MKTVLVTGACINTGVAIVEKFAAEGYTVLFTGRSPEKVAAAEAAYRAQFPGATVIGFTDSKLSPLGQCSDHVLIAKSDMVSLVDSLVAPLSVVNALLVSLATAREQEIQKNLETLERVWEEYNIYEKRVDNP